MNVSEERKSEILEEIFKIQESNDTNFNRNKYDRISSYSDTGFLAFSFIGEKQSYSIEDLKIIRLLLEISTDWKELCFELPKPKKEWESEVKKIRDGDYALEVIIKLNSKSDCFKYISKLKAQQQIYDIIAKTQYDIDPDWIADWSDIAKEKTYLLLNREDMCIDYRITCIYQSLDFRLYMSGKVALHIIKNNLITKELWLEAFGEIG